MNTKELVKERENSAEEIVEKHTYMLSSKLEKRGMTYDDKNNPRPDPEYPKQRNLLLRSSIIWPGGKDPFSNKERNKGKYLIRYYDGCSTLFVDDQPKDKETIEQLVRSTRELYFMNGYLHVYGYDTMLHTYMDWASWNEGSPYKVPTADPIFLKLDSEKEKEKEAATVDEVERALELAKKADDKKMLIHSRFIDVPEMDYRTGEKFSIKSIRVEYRKAAMNNTKRFLETYNDKTLAYRFWIEKALSNEEISTKAIPNQASWGKKGKVICDVSGLKSHDLILNKLVEFSQSEEGKTFKDELESLYS